MPSLFAITYGMYFILAFKNRDGNDWTVPADGWKQLGPLLFWGLDRVGFDFDNSATYSKVFESTESISLIIQVPLKWSKMALGCVKNGWELNLSPLSTEVGILTLNFSGETDMDNGIRRLFSAVEGLALLVTLQRKTVDAYNKLEHHQREAVARLIRECKNHIPRGCLPNLRENLNLAEQHLEDQFWSKAMTQLRFCSYLATDSIGRWIVER